MTDETRRCFIVPAVCRRRAPVPACRARASRRRASPYAPTSTATVQHAAVRCEAHDRKRLEQLSRDITRPALAVRRTGAVQRRRVGGVEARDAVARRQHAPGDVAAGAHAAAAGAGSATQTAPDPIPWGAGAERETARVWRAARARTSETVERSRNSHRVRAARVQSQPDRIRWARLLECVFDIDMQRGPNCGSRELKIIAAILERAVIEKILSHLGLDPQPPPRGRAREAGQD